MGKNTYSTRKSYFDAANDRKDDNQQLGFDYRDQLMKRSLSNYMFGDKKRDGIIEQFNDLYVYLVDSAKNIKKTFNFAIKRNSRNIN